METTSGEEVFAFIAAAAAGTGNDDHQKEKGVQDTIEPATKKQRNHTESHHTEAEVSKKELELLTRHLQSIHSSCGHCSNETWVRAFTSQGSQTTYSQTCTRLCPSIVSGNPKSTSSPSRKLGSHSSQVGKAFRLIRQNGLTPQRTLNTSFRLSLMKVVI